MKKELVGVHSWDPVARGQINMKLPHHLLFTCSMWEHTHSHVQYMCVALKCIVPCHANPETLSGYFHIISRASILLEPGIKTSSTGKEGSVSGNNWGNIACLEERATILREGPESHFIFLPITFSFFVFFFFSFFFWIKVMWSWG